MQRRNKAGRRSSQLELLPGLWLQMGLELLASALRHFSPRKLRMAAAFFSASASSEPGSAQPTPPLVTSVVLYISMPEARSTILSRVTVAISERGVSVCLNFQNKTFRCSMALSVSLSRVNDVDPDISVRRRGVLSTTGIAASQLHCQPSLQHRMTEAICHTSRCRGQLARKAA